jgi:carboxymethylenebutenolidase
MLSTANEEETFPPVVLGGLDYLISQPSVKARTFGVVGFSMGAAWALWLGSQRQSDIDRVVTFYGTYAVDFSKSNSSYLGHYSPEDEWEPVTEIRKLEEKIRQANRPVQFHLYPGTKHWFFEEDRPEYNPRAARQAWTRTLEFLQKTQ